MTAYEHCYCCLALVVLVLVSVETDGISLLVAVVCGGCRMQFKQTMNSKQQASDDSKSEYALELQKTNDAQREHFESVMPQIFQVHIPAVFFLNSVI